MGAIQFVRCWLGWHHRDKRRARHDASGVLITTCKGCRRPMVKEGEDWRLA